MAHQMHVRGKYLVGENANVLQNADDHMSSSMSEPELERSSHASSSDSECFEIERSVLLFGLTGKGKSTVANVLAKMFDDSMFPVSYESSSHTFDIDSREFIIDRYKLEIIDTIGLKDTRFGTDVVLKKLEKVTTFRAFRRGINQIFFVTNGRITKDDEEVFRSLEEIFGEKSVYDYVTVLRTGADRQFGRPEREQSDIDSLLRNQHGRVLVEKVGRERIVHISNPQPEGSNPTWLEIRQKSRKVLMDHLEKCNSLFLPEASKKHFHLLVDHARGSDEEKRLRREIHEMRRERDQALEEIQRKNRALEEASRRNLELRQELEKRKKDSTCFIL